MARSGSPVVGVLLVAAALGWWAASPSTVRAQQSGGGPTYSREVAPILFRTCSACHRPQGPAPFSVLRYDDVRPWAAAIAAAVEARRMPPWLPERGLVDYVDERRLPDRDIELIRRWAEGGAAEGNPADLPEPPAYVDGWQLGRPDLIVTLPAYDVPAGGSDVYRNLVAAIPVESTRYVKAVEIRPGGMKVVHHARMMVDTTRSSREIDAEDAEPGFDGMHVTSRAFDPDGFFIGWTPGHVAVPGTDTLAWRLDPGTDMVLQIHVRPRGEVQRVEPQVGLHFAPAASSVVPVVVSLGSRDIDIPAGASGVEVTDAFVLPVDVDVLGVYPHAHYIGREVQGFARLPNGRTRWLLRIRDWDFNWQDEYRLTEPLFLPRGSTVTMRWIFDNTARNPRNPNRPPQRVVYGSRSTDEMANLVIQVRPRTRDDREVLDRDLRWKQLADASGWVAREAYRDALQHLAEGRFVEATERLREALSYQPSAAAHAAMAEALVELGRRSDAALHLREAIRLAEATGDDGLVATLRRRLRDLRP